MPRTSKHDVEVAFTTLCQAMGKKRTSHKVSIHMIAHDKQQVGTWDLDFYYSGGGYKIIEMEINGTTRTHPLINNRLPAKAFVEACLMAASAVNLYKKDQAPARQIGYRERTHSKNATVEDYVKEEIRRHTKFPQQFEIKEDK